MPWVARPGDRDVVGGIVNGPGVRPYIARSSPARWTWSEYVSHPCPIVLTDACDTVGDVGDLILANMGGYRAITKAGGEEFATSMHLWFDQGVEAFRLTFRMDGEPILASAITPPNSSSTRSHFATIAVRS
jgi:hypothetical protein